MDNGSDRPRPLPVSQEYILKPSVVATARQERSWLKEHARMPLASSLEQGLKLVHFSAQLEPCLTHQNTLHTLNTP